MSTTEQAAHTPGPWATTEASGGREPLNVPLKARALEGMGISLCFINSDDKVRSEEAAANARLIAMAPDLLSMVHRLEVAANTVKGCLDRRPENFAMAMRELKDLAAEARELQAKVAA